VLAGHEDLVTSVALTADGRIVTGSYDETARIWDAASGKELARLGGHESVVTSVAATADGRIVTGSWDQTGRIVPIFPYGQALIDQAKITLQRCLKLGDRERDYLSSTPPFWCYELRMWPFTPTSLLIGGKSLLNEGQLAEAKAKFDDARCLDPSLGAEIDALLA
jgi:hypothetical protein